MQYGLRAIGNQLMDKYPSHGGPAKSAPSVSQPTTPHSPTQEKLLDTLLAMAAKKIGITLPGLKLPTDAASASPHLTAPDQFHPYRGQVSSPMGMYMHSVSTKLEAAYEKDPSGKGPEIAKIYREMKTGLPAIMQVEDIWQAQQKANQALRKPPTATP